GGRGTGELTDPGVRLQYEKMACQRNDAVSEQEGRGGVWVFLFSFEEGMAMLYRSAAAGVLAALALAAWTMTARAGDTVLLKGGVSAPTVTLGLDADDDTDTLLVRAYFHGRF